MRTERSIFSRAALALLVAGGLAAQGDRLLGLVRDQEGAPVAGARVRAFLLDEHAAEDARALEVQTDARGQFVVRAARRAALWIDGDGGAAFVAEAAPGAPVIVRVAPRAVLELAPGARGAHVRLAGAPVGFVAGDRLALPAVPTELLVECDDARYLAAADPGPGARVSCPRPAGPPPRLLDVPSGADVRLEAWPRLSLSTVDGAVSLPVTDRPVRVRVATHDDGDARFEDLWLEPGRARTVGDDRGDWRGVRVVGPGGVAVCAARVTTVRVGPGLPFVASASASDADGLARFRDGVDGARVVVDADGFARASVHALDLVGRDGDAAREIGLEPGAALRLRVLGEHGLPLSGALVRTRDAPELEQRAWTDGRGGAVLTRLPRGEVTVSVEHVGYVPCVTDVETGANGPIVLELERGRELRGRVIAEHAALTGVLVEVRPVAPGRDASTRRVTVAADGTFVVTGLGDGPVDLLAHRTERGVTWSGRVRDVVPGGAPVTITIRCDDPSPDGR